MVGGMERMAGHVPGHEEAEGVDSIAETRQPHQELALSSRVTPAAQEQHHNGGRQQLGYRQVDYN